MILFPPAKVNLGLNVRHKRVDGYHEIETCMVCVPFYDVLEILPADEFTFTQSGIVVPGNKDTNLCVKAYRLMAERFNLPAVWIHLRKEIPMGAGLGGGSSDATYTLKGLNELFNLGCTARELEELAAQLGSDCPFFVESLPKIATGRGEILTEFPLDLAGNYIKIVYPAIHVNTRNAFAGLVLSGEKQEPLESVLSGEQEKWKATLKNSFEHSVFKEHPLLAMIKKELYEEGAWYAAMSGSGSAIIGLYKNLPSHSFSSRIGYTEVIRLLVP
jgi:4-diphosphocytidyl-2-C-methyl-D-erythritol kinase